MGGRPIFPDQVARMNINKTTVIVIALLELALLVVVVSCEIRRISAVNKYAEWRKQVSSIIRAGVVKDKMEADLKALGMSSHPWDKRSVFGSAKVPKSDPFISNEGIVVGVNEIIPPQSIFASATYSDLLFVIVFDRNQRVLDSFEIHRARFI